MKKFINHPEDVVEEMLQGLVVLHPGSARLPGHKALIRADAAAARDRQVAILSGGGSGHEPAHAGYIGAGMLSAAVAGEVFTSPSSDTVYAAIQAVAAKPGALLVVKNYTGDRLNFGLAAEMARAEGTAVEIVVVDDDVALEGADRATGSWSCRHGLHSQGGGRRSCRGQEPGRVSSHRQGGRCLVGDHGCLVFSRNLARRRETQLRARRA